MTRIQVGGRGYWYEEILRYELNVPVNTAIGITNATHVRLILNELEEVTYQGQVFKRHVVVDLPPGPISEAFRFFCQCFAQSNTILDLDERLARKDEILAMIEKIKADNMAKAQTPAPTPGGSLPSGPTLLKPIKRPKE